MTISKEISLSTLASTVGSLLVLIPALWFVGKPLVTDALADDIKQVVQKEAEPIKDAFSILLMRDINAIRKEIAALQFRQRQGTDWTQDDAEYLADLEIELEALNEAKDALKDKTE